MKGEAPLEFGAASGCGKERAGGMICDMLLPLDGSAPRRPDTQPEYAADDMKLRDEAAQGDPGEQEVMRSPVFDLS